MRSRSTWDDFKSNNSSRLHRIETQTQSLSSPRWTMPSGLIKDLQARVGGQRSSLNSSTYQPLSLPSILILGIQWTGSNPILLPSQTQNSRSDQDTSSSVTSWWWADQVLWIIQSLDHSWVRTAQWDTSPPPRKKQAELRYRSQSTWWIESNSSQSKSHNATVELRPVPHLPSLEIFSGSVLCGLVEKPSKNAWQLKKHLKSETG